MECRNIQELYLYNNELDDDPIEDFTNLLSLQKNLYILALEMNRIGYKGLAFILNALTDHKKLEKLYLNNNDINS